MSSCYVTTSSLPIKPKDGCKAIAFGPVAAFTITYYNDMRLGLKRHQLFVLFDGEGTHRGDGLWGTFLMKSPIFSEGGFPNETHFFNTSFLLVISLKPNLTIGMGQGKSLEEARKTVPVQVYSTDNVCHGIKGGEMRRIM
jgi:hypothetical protein